MRSTGPDSNFANVEGGIAFDFTESGGHVMAARLADDAVTVTEIQLQAGRRAFLKRRDVSREVKDWVRGEPGSRFAALIGVDAYTVGDYVVVVNRAQVLVDARSFPKGQFYRKYRRSGEVDPHAKVAELKDQVVKEWDDFASEVQLLTPDAGQKRIDEILELQNEVRRWEDRGAALDRELGAWQEEVRALFEEEYAMTLDEQIALIKKEAGAQ